MLQLDKQNIGLYLASIIKKLCANKLPHQIARALGLKIVFEKPIVSNYSIRFSEYRPNRKEIAIFYKDFQKEAICHEIFHFLERQIGLKLSKEKSEREARIFTCALIK